ncbi:MAG: B12-binding domain-containing radical SAM protein [Thermoplasmatales archaeon]|nr:MAG: B12-binding domain-containing radical SAM protein [Thermoplasmatales archaeon]
MKILFIYPNPTKTIPSSIVKFLSMFSNPIIPAFKALTNVTPNEHSINIIDERIENIDYDEDYDLVGITVMTNQATKAYLISKEFRKRGKKVVLGGWHPSVLPDEAKQYADSIVIGEAEELWPQLLNDVEKGKLKQIYRQEKPVDLAYIPNFGNGRIKPKGINSAVAIEATRGCPHGCNFCAISHSPGRRVFRVRPVEQIIKEIQKIPQKYLLFSDASMTINTKYTKELFKNMKGLDKKFYCYGNANVLFKDEELLKLAHEAGCISWTIGFDSISQKSLDSIGKKTNVANQYISVINKIHDFGMNVEGSFMFGFDTDTPDIFDSTLNFICKSDLDKAEFHILTPFPGTPLFDEYEKQNRIIIKDWSKYDGKNVVYKPMHLTAEELLNGIQRMYNGFYNPSNILRMIGRNVNKGLFPLITITSISFQGLTYRNKNIMS